MCGVRNDGSVQAATWMGVCRQSRISGSMDGAASYS